MNKWIKKHIPTPKSIKNSRELKPIFKYLNAPTLWSFDRESVARGVSVGFAAAVIPGLQFLYAAILVIISRGNLPVALLATLITNPLTVIPIIFFICYVGSHIIHNGSASCLIQDFSWNFHSFPIFWEYISNWMLQFGKAFLAGVLVVSLSLAVIGYFGTHLVWNLVEWVVNKNRK